MNNEVFMPADKYSCSLLPPSIGQSLEDGRVRDLLNLQAPEDFHIHDIANRLAKINRYAGALKFPLSVATHSVMVSHLLGDGYLSFLGLMHDITESFGIGDMASPIKRLLPGYVELENRIWKQCCAALDLPVKLPKDVHIADERAYQLESLYIRGAYPWPEHTKFPATAVTPREGELCYMYLFNEIPWQVSAKLFVDRWIELKGLGV